VKRRVKLEKPESLENLLAWSRSEEEVRELSQIRMGAAKGHLTLVQTVSEMT